jgi:glycerophosphoryl diester phosphodiesterase
MPQWVAELFSSCPTDHDGRWKDRDVLVVAHRGAACEEPENTIAALDAALDRHKCSAIEIDLSFTRDGEVVLWHDWNPNDAVSIARQAALEEAVHCRPVVPDLGSKWRLPVPQLDLDDLRKHYGYGVKSVGSKRIVADIPTLDEFFAWAVKRRELGHVHFDIKIPHDQPEYVEPMMCRIDELVEEHNPKFRIIYSTPCMPILEAMEERSFHPNYAFDVEPPFGFVLRPGRFSSARIALRFKNGFATSVHPKVTTIAPWTTYRRVVQADVRTRERHNRRNPEVPLERVFVATINERDLIRCLLAIGVDGIITDDPDLVREEADRAGREVC